MSPWYSCTVTQVEEVKGILRCMPIAMSTMFLYMVVAQTQTWSITQGYTMERRIGKHYLFPPATLSAIAIGFVLLEVAAYDCLFVPYVRRYTGHRHGLSHLQRIGVGLAVSVVAMAYAALLESIRLDIARGHQMQDLKNSIVPLSIFWQLPLHVLLGTAILFAHAGLFEFFYYESPMRMRTSGTALSMVPIALGLYQNGGFMVGINAVSKKFGQGWLASSNLNQNHLNYYYLFMAVMSLFNFGIYLVTARFYKYKEFITIASVGSKSHRAIEYMTTPISATSLQQPTQNYRP